MKYLLTGVAAIALLTGCGGKKNKDNAENAARKAPAAIEGVMDVKLRAGDPASAAAALSAFSLDNSGIGRVAFADSNLKGDSATFTDVVITPTDEDGDEDTPIVAKKLTFDGLSMIDGHANFARMTLTGITIQPDADNISIELDDGEKAEVDATIGKIELINPSPETAAWVASLMGKSAPVEMPIGKALSFDKWAMDDLSFNVNEEDGKQGAFVIDSVKITGLKDERADQMLLKNVHLDMFDSKDDGNTRFNVTEINVRNADVSFLKTATDNAGDTKDLASAISGLMTMNQNPIDPGYDYFNINGMDIGVEGASFAVPNLTARVVRNKAGQPVRVFTEPYKMTLAADTAGGELGEQLAGGLAMLGYDKLVLTGESDADYDPDTDTLTYKAGQNYVQLKDGFKMNFGGEVEGYNSYAKASNRLAFEGDAPDPAAMMAAMDDLILHNFEIRIDDDSIVDRAFNAYAAQSGEDPQQVRNQLVGLLAMAPMMAGGSGVDMALITDTTKALSGFLTSGGTLTVKVDPKQPIKIGELGKMDDPSLMTKEYLGYSASHEK